MYLSASLFFHLFSSPSFFFHSPLNYLLLFALFQPDETQPAVPEAHLILTHVASRTMKTTERSEFKRCSLILRGLKSEQD